MDRFEVGIAVFVVVALLLTGWFSVAVINAGNASIEAQRTAPCEAFRSWRARDVPARCISYYEGGR